MRRTTGHGLARVLMIAAAAVALAGIALAVWWFRRPAVSVTRVIEGPVVEAFYATGTVRPRLEYPISSNVGGIVTRVLVHQGQIVKPGQELARVSDPMLQFNADKAAADLRTRVEFADPANSPVLRQFDQQIDATQQMLDAARQVEKRFANLAQHNAGSANDRDQAFEHQKKIWADLESLKAQRDVKLRELQQDAEVAASANHAAQEDLLRETLRSPVDGAVLDQPIAQGTRVEVNGHVMQIADCRPQNLIMRAAVDEENIAQVDPGQGVKMTLYSFPGRVFDGTVEQKYPKADPNRRTFEVDVKFAAGDPKLQPGMTGELAFIQQTRRRAMIVPSQALQDGAVWTIRSGKLARSPATVGIKSIERIEITAGLSPGDLVVISPITGLSQGRSVRIGARVDPKVAADLNKPKESDVFQGFQ